MPTSDPKRPLKVFLCHASADKLKIWEIYRYLKRRGIQPWFDEVNLIGGQNWRVEIPEAIKSSDAIIICLTQNSVDKEGYIQSEIKFALDKALEMPEGRIFIIPVRLDDCEVPSGLKDYQWVDLFDQDGFTRLMKSLRTRAAQLERATVQVPKPDETTPNFTTVLSQEISKDVTPDANNILAQSLKEKNLDKKQDSLAQGFRRNWIAISLVVLIISACILCAFLISTSLVTKLLSHTPTSTITTTSTYTTTESQTPNLLMIQTPSVTLTQESITTLTQIPTNTLVIPTSAPVSVPTNTLPVHITIPTDAPFAPTSEPTNTLSLPTWTFTPGPTAPLPSSTPLPQDYPTIFGGEAGSTWPCGGNAQIRIEDKNGIVSVIFYPDNNRSDVVSASLATGDKYNGEWGVTFSLAGYTTATYIYNHFVATDMLGNSVSSIDYGVYFNSYCP